MPRPIVLVLGALFTLLGVVAIADAQTPPGPLNECHGRACFVEVLSGEGYNAIARRLSPEGVTDAQVSTFGSVIRVANGNPTTIHPGQLLHYDGLDVPVPPPTTTTTTEVSPSTTTTTTTVPPATTLPATTTTTVAPTTTTTTAAPPPSGDFLATFDTPGDFYDRFDTEVHFRANDYNPGAEFHGDHNDACQGPTTGRTVHLDGDDNDEVFWWCAPGGPTTGHIMTGMGPAEFGYALVSFKPKQSFTDVSRVCVDVNNTQLGGDKWWEMSVLPKSVFDANGGRMDYITPLASFDQTGLDFPPDSFVFQVTDNKLRGYQGMNELIFDWFEWSTSDRAQRFEHCMVDNGNGTVTMSRETGNFSAPEDAPNGVRTVTVPGSFPAGEVVVLLQDSTYDPPKHGSGPDQTTWHWKNVRIE